MAYSTKGDVLNAITEDKLVELTDVIDSGSEDDDIITRAIADADAEIDLYCRKKYDVPFTTVDNVIRKLSVDIAIYNLFPRSHSVPEIHTTRYTRATEMLTAIRDGDLRLDIDETGPTSNAKDVKPEFTRGKKDYDGNLLGDVMGQWDDEAGSLDSW